MKPRHLASVLISIFAPLFLLALLSQGMARAAEQPTEPQSYILIEPDESEPESAASKLASLTEQRGDEFLAASAIPAAAPDQEPNLDEPASIDFDAAMAGSDVIQILKFTGDAPEARVGEDGISTKVAAIDAEDLVISKSAFPDPVYAGRPLTYTIVISNVGTNTASQVVLTDTLPSEVSLVNISEVCTGTPPNLSCSLGTIQAGRKQTVTIEVNVDASATGPIVNRAGVTSNGVDDNINNNSTSVSTDVLPATNLVISKSADPSTAVAGDTLTYTVTVNNDGFYSAPGVMVTDTLPSEVTFVSATDGCTEDAGIVECDLGEVGISSSDSITIAVTVNHDATSPLNNSAFVTGDIAEYAPGDEDVNLVTTVTTEADLALSKVDAPDPVIAGNILTYTIQVDNNGPSDATNVVVTDTLPTEVSFFDSSAECLASSGTNCELGTIPAGGSDSITIVVTVNSGALGTITNQAKVSSDATETDPGNETATADTLVEAEVDLSIEKTDEFDPVLAGNNLTYTLTINNAGPSDATGVVVTDALPSEVTFVKATSGCMNPPEVECSPVEIPAGGNAAITVVVEVNSDVLGPINNLAGVRSTTTDVALGNNTATEETTVNADADLSIVKTDFPDPVNAGDRLTYTLTINNNGPSDALGVVVTDTLPADVVFADGSVECSDVGDIECILGDIPAGGGDTITVAVTVNDNAAGIINNSAQVDSATPDENQDNNTDPEDTSITAQVDLSITKSDDPDPVIAGQVLTYTIEVFNNGPSDAANVIITDTLPAEVSYLGSSDSCGLNGNVICNVGQLTAGNGTSITITAIVDDTYLGFITNTAEVGNDIAEIDPTDNDASETTEVIGSADLWLQKFADPDPVNAGAFLTYTLSVQNLGPSAANSVVVTDTLPAGVNFIQATPTQGGPCTGSLVIRCPLGQITAGESATVTIRVILNSNLQGNLSNSAEVKSGTADPDGGNNSATIDTTVNRLADLSVGKSGLPDPVIAGQFVTYTIVVNNNGPSDAIGVAISDTLPLSTTLVSAQVTQSAAVIQSIETSQFSPPSPDPAGIEYLDFEDYIMFSDSEVEEMPIYQGVNLFYMTLTGNQVIPPDPTTTLAYSDEPTGLGYDLVNRLLYISDDSPNSVHEVAPGDDGIYGTSDDIVRTITNIGSTDAEGVAYDRVQGHLFVSDGLGQRIYEVDPAGNGTVITSFDVGQYGIEDPEGIAYNPSSNTLFIGDLRNPTVIETTMDGDLLRTIDLVDPAISTAGISIGPSSVNPSAFSMYIADRNIDNNTNPNENDGVIYEITIPSPSGPGGVCNGTTTIQCGLGTLVAGGNSLVTIVVQVDPRATTTLTNTVEVTTNTPESNQGNNTATVETGVITSADLSIIKVDDPDPVLAGGTLTYTLTISNSGPSKALGVVVTDTLPTGTTISSTLTSLGTNCVGLTEISCALGDLEAGSQAAITIVVGVDSSALISLANSAEVQSLTVDAVPTNNFVTEATTVTNQADLTLNKIGIPDPVTAGTNLTYTLVVTNNGPSAAQGVVVTDTLPVGVTLVSTASSQGTGCGLGPVVVCNLGQIPVGSQATITLVVSVDSGVIAPLQNTAEVKSATADLFPEDNQVQILTQVNTESDLRLFKVDEPDPVVAGTNLTYTLTISNPGPSDAQSVVVTDTLPAEAGYVSATTTQGAGCTGTGVVVCQLGTVTVGQVVTVTIVTSLDSSLLPTTLTNNAVVNSPTFDPVEANNSSTIPTLVVTSSDLVVTKESQPDPVTAGQNVTYILTVQNLGPSDASGIVVTDTLPAEVSILSAVASAGSGCTTGPLAICNLDDLVFDSTATITIVAALDPGAGGVITNTVSVRGDQPDPIIENNDFELITSVNRVGTLPLIKIDDPDPVVAGTTLTYTLYLSSTGPSNANGVVLTDTLPSQVQYLNHTTDRGTCINNAGVLNCQLGNMPVGTDATIEIVTAVDPAVVGQINNLATVNADSAVPTIASQNTNVVGSADLLLVGHAVPDPVPAGGLLTYTLAVTNTGPSVATQVRINNPLPSGVTFNSSPDCTPSGSIVTCNLGTLGVDASTTALIVVNVNSNAVGLLSSVATVFSNTPDPNPSNNSTVIITPIFAESDLVISKSGAPLEVTAGETLTYTIVVTNSGPSNAALVQVSDTLPAELTLQSTSTSQGAGCGATNPLVCNLGTIPSGSEATVTIVANVKSSTTATIVNTASVSSSSVDPEPGNNSSTETTPVQTSADLSLSKINAQKPITAGVTLTYTIAITNSGPSDALNVEVSDTLPAGLTLTSATPSKGGPCTGDPAINCPIGSITAGGTETVIVVAEVNPDQDETTSLSNTAQVTSDTTDPAPADNSDTDVTAVEVSVDIDLELTTNPDMGTSGELLTYTLEVTNNGPSLAKSVVVTTTLPAEAQLQNVSAGQGPGCIINSQIVCDLEDMNPNTSVTVTMVTLIDEMIQGELEASSVGKSASGDSDMSNNASVITTTVVQKEYNLYLPIIANGLVKGEENDTCETAFPISTNVTNYFFAEDSADWYQFDLVTTGKLVVQLTNFKPLFGQIAVYKGNNCNSVVALGNNGNASTTKTVDVGTQTAGHYYIFISNDGAVNSVDPYSLRANFTPN